MVSAGIDIGGTRVKIGLIRGRELLCQHVFDVSQNKSLALELPVIFDQLDQLLAGLTFPAILESIGFAIPSLVDHTRMRIISNYVKYCDAKDLDLKSAVSDRYGVKAAVENDARAALVGEHIFGAGQGYEDLVMVTLGTGIGSAVMMEGRLLRGRQFKAGNLAGHMTLDINGMLCNCGDVGCAETVASGWVLKDKYRQFTEEPLPETLDYQWILNNISKHDVARQLWNQLINGWCHTLKNLVYAYDPQCILVSGGIVNSGEELLAVFQQFVDKLSWGGQDQVVILPATYPDWSGVMGAAWMALNKN
jgi:glucokinase